MVQACALQPTDSPSTPKFPAETERSRIITKRDPVARRIAVQTNDRVRALRQLMPSLVTVPTDDVGRLHVGVTNTGVMAYVLGDFLDLLNQVVPRNAFARPTHLEIVRVHASVQFCAVLPSLEPNSYVAA